MPELARTKRLIIFATLREAAATIQALAADKTGCDRYSFAGGEIMLCGMGLEAAARSISTAPTEGYSWLNVGAAGSVDARVPVGAFRSIGRVTLLPTEDFLILDSSDGALLYSSPTPVYEVPKRCVDGALVDMEGYAIAYAAQKKGVPLEMKKIVSDHCSQTSHADILANIDWLSRQMADEIFNMIHWETTPTAFASLRGCSL